MSLVFPTIKNPRSIRMSSFAPTIFSRAHSGRSLVQISGTHWWQIDASWPPLTRAQAHEMLAFLMQLNGRAETFSFIPPNTKTPRGLGQSAVGLDGIKTYATVGAGYADLWTTGWEISKTGVLLKGDLIRFTNHKKVYMVVADANSNSSGYSRIYFAPAMFSGVQEEEAVTVYDTPITCRLVTDVCSMSIDEAMIYGLSLQMEEAW